MQAIRITRDPGSRSPAARLVPFTVLLFPLSAALAACGSDPTPVDGGPSGASCPTGEGPPLVLVSSGSEPFCMDKTEVSRADYAKFLASAPATGKGECVGRKPAAARAECSTRLPACSGANCDRLPQTCIDYCDAQTYCEWAGKTLCGTADGKMLTSAQIPDTWQNVWSRACRNKKSPSDPGTKYSFGNDAKFDACNIGDRPGTGCSRPEDACTPLESGSLATCHGVGTYEGIFDLGGNVQEFVYGVISDESGRKRASVFGGDYRAYIKDQPQVFSCEGSDGISGDLIDHTEPFIGFRCCATVR